MIRGLSVAFGLLVVPGCTLVTTYPERGVELCDGLRHDEDLDGRTDCDDPDCIGHCPEESIGTCTNGVDDDGDDRIDAADPRCWPYSRVSIERCATVHGVDTDLLGGLAETWTQVGAGSLVPDPTTPAHHVFSLEGEQTTITSARLFPGRWVGTRIDARLWLEASALVIVGLPYEAAPDAPDHPTLWLQVGSIEAHWGDAMETSPLPPARGWVAVTLEIEAGPGPGELVLHATVVREHDGARAEARAPSAGTFPPADAVRLVLGLAVPAGTGGRALFDYASIHREDYLAQDGCGAAVGELVEPPGSLVRASDGSLCAFTRGDAHLGGTALWRSHDEGLTWTEEPLGGSDVWGQARLVPSVTSDGFIGAGRTRADDAQAHVIHASADCTSLVDLGPAFAGGDPTFLAQRLGVTLGEDVVSGMPSPQLELWSIDAASGGLPRAVSPTGEAGSYARALGTPFTPEMHATDPGFDTRTTVTSFGRDHVWVAPSADGATEARPAPTLDLFVDSERGLVRVGAPIAPSAVAGRYDGDCVGDVMLVELPGAPPASFTGRALVRCGDGPTALLPFRVTTP